MSDEFGEDLEAILLKKITEGKLLQKKIRKEVVDASYESFDGRYERLR